jgi:methyltransferase-like protein/2-polyprenyl-3-methyl-5-hydroxy-6-metoxy-1,4-benzoquinol methylase
MLTSGTTAAPDSTIQPAYSYDRLPYPSAPFPQTHPSRLAVLAALHGMRPAPPAKCRVLELGCGEGGNLIPMAYQSPDSTFVGIDLSAPAIERGKKTIAELALSNIKMRALDIVDLSSDIGQFDYIIAHGIYSWVPAPVREKVLDVFRTNLAPQGVAFVSYNCHPGSYLRDLTRAIMLFHVRDTADPEQRVHQAKLLLRLLAETSNDKEIYGQVIRNQYERVAETNDVVLYHDDLEPSAEAFFLYQVTEEAARHGLQYLSDARVRLLTGSLLELQAEPGAATKMLQQIPADEWVVREQYFDLINGRMFRETLLCHHEVRLERPVAPSRIRDFHFLSDIVSSDSELDPRQSGTAEFKTRAGQKLRTDHGLAKAAFLHLNEIWPNSVGFDDLAAAAQSRLAGRDNSPQPVSNADIESLTEVLLRTFCAGTMEVEAFPSAVMATDSDRPKASLLARKQLEKGTLLTNLRHSNVLLEDRITQRLLLLLDGTRTVDELVTALQTAVASEPSQNSGSAPGPTPVISRENVMSNLRLLARLSLLAA